MQDFDIYFLGETLADADPVEVRNGVAALFKISGDAVERLFSGKAVRVKHGVDVDTAGRYREAFRNVGALVQIVPAGAPAPDGPAVARAPTPPVAGGGQSPGGMTLAEPGATLDHTPPPPPAQIDISGLEALPPNSGSLEDCHQPVPPRTIPDISHMQLVDD
ncbi:MAG: hypothetical protein KDI88_03840 [Gammaproteobacteria bacterium]|nr:hypothetical protein [Gammaproteobacteria bacterium]